MYKRILVPLDGSTLAEQALPHALELGRLMGSHVCLLRVSLSAFEVVSRAGIEVLNADELIRHDREAAVAYLEALLGRWHQTGLSVATEVLPGTIAETIIDYAKDKNIDLIVMCTHGRSGLSRWVYGSVAEKVLRGAHCPVLIIRNRPLA